MIKTDEITKEGIAAIEDVVKRHKASAATSNDLLCAGEAYASTPADELRRQIMSSMVPKNEREHWACRRIEELEKALKPFANFACSERNGCACNNCIARDLLST